MHGAVAQLQHPSCLVHRTTVATVASAVARSATGVATVAVPSPECSSWRHAAWDVTLVAVGNSWQPRHLERRLMKQQGQSVRCCPHVPPKIRGSGTTDPCRIRPAVPSAHSSTASQEIAPVAQKRQPSLRLESAAHAAAMANPTGAATAHSRTLVAIAHARALARALARQVVAPVMLAYATASTRIQSAFHSRLKRTRVFLSCTTTSEGQLELSCRHSAPKQLWIMMIITMMILMMMMMMKQSRN